MQNAPFPPTGLPHASDRFARCGIRLGPYPSSGGCRMVGVRTGPYDGRGRAQNDMPGSRLVAVFFIYGLAFFAMGLAFALEARRKTELRLVWVLKYLAAYGLLHAAVEWIDMWQLLPGVSPATIPAVLRIVRLALFVASTVMLAVFGAALIAALAPRFRAVRWIPLGLLVIWLAYWVIGPHLNPLATARWAPDAGSCLRCHAASAPLDASTPASP